MNKERLDHTIKKLEKYLIDSLGLIHKTNSLSPSKINNCIISACVYNTYIETLCNKSDTIFRYIKESNNSMFMFSYLDFINQVSKKINLKKKRIVLAFDYTNEVFWGNVNDLDIIGTKKSEKGTGAFKFLTCSQVSGYIDAKIPLISIPIGMGHNKTRAITHCLTLLKDCIDEIDLILFDREYYNKELMMTLNQLKIPYLIFVPKKKGEINDTLEAMYTGETRTKTYKFDVNKNKTVYHDETNMNFLKEMFDGRSYAHYDWCFVTNVKHFDINKMIPMYKCRWRIETGFRVQDEADSRTKSKEMIIRYFFFLYEQLLQSIWYVFFKKNEEVSFKQFLITLHNYIQENNQLEGSKVHVKSEQKQN
jgi:ubiquitin